MEEQADWRQTEPMEEQEQTERRRGRIFRARMFYVQVRGARAIFNSFPSMQRHKANVKFRPNLGVLSPLSPPPPRVPAPMTGIYLSRSSEFHRSSCWYLLADSEMSEEMRKIIRKYMIPKSSLPLQVPTSQMFPEFSL